MHARAPADDPELEVVLAAYEAFARGDIAAATADMDAEVEWIPPPAPPMRGRRLGPAAVAEYLEASRQGWKHVTSEPTATRVGPEIVVVHRLHGILLDGTPHETEVGRRLPLPRGTDRPHARLRGTRGGLRRGPAAALDRRLSRGLGVQRPRRRRQPLHRRRGVYRLEPWETWLGREEIVAGWLEHADKPGDTSFHWWHVARDGDLWIVEARTRYHNLGKDYANLWLVELDDEGRARGFSEWWKQFPDDAGG